MRIVHNVYAYECVFIEYINVINVCLQNRFDFTVTEISFKLIDIMDSQNKPVTFLKKLSLKGICQKIRLMFMNKN